MEWGLHRVVPAAAVTTHAKPHAQQQLARDLGSSTLPWGSAVGLKGSARCSEAIRSHVDSWISCEPQLCCCIADVRGGNVVGEMKKRLSSGAPVPDLHVN